MDLSTLPRTELLREVTDLIALHAELIDDDQLEAWPDLFVEDCHYSVLPRENADRGLPVATIFCDSRGMLVARIVSLRRANIFPVHHYRHIISTSRIHEVRSEIGRAHVCTPVTNAHLVCRLLLEKNNIKSNTTHFLP